MNPLDFYDAAKDGIAMALGASLSTPHPLAGDYASAIVAARKIGAAQRPGAFDNDTAILARGLSSSDFPRLLAESAQLAVVQTFDAGATHRAFCAVEPLPDFRAADVLTLDGSVSLAEGGQLQEITSRNVVEDANGQAMQLRTFAAIAGFSRETIVNDNLGAIRRAIRALAVSAANVESCLIAEALESNPTLEDGESFFHEAHRNRITASLTDDLAGLPAAIQCLRTQRLASGQMANNKARYLVVAVNLEFSAQKMLYEAGIRDVEIHVLAGLPDGRWFLMADPAVAPCVARLTLQASRRDLNIEPMPRRINFDGVLTKVRIDTGAALLSRVGIVKGGA